MEEKRGQEQGFLLVNFRQGEFETLFSAFATHTKICATGIEQASRFKVQILWWRTSKQALAPMSTSGTYIKNSPS